MAQTVDDIMTRDPVVMKATDPVVEAARAMRENDIGDVIVLDDGDQICGIVTDRDITVRAVAEGRSVAETRLGDICSSDITTVAPGETVGHAIKLMTERAVRRLPVVDGRRPIGVVSLGDLAVNRDPDSALADISAAEPNN